MSLWLILLNQDTNAADTWPSHPYVILPQTSVSNSESVKCVECPCMISFAGTETSTCSSRTMSLCTKKGPWRHGLTKIPEQIPDLLKVLGQNMITLKITACLCQNNVALQPFIKFVVLRFCTHLMYGQILDRNEATGLESTLCLCNMTADIIHYQYICYTCVLMQ